ncbi:hypothetical protein RRG08_010661 [Elysia crispata]|uniref:N-acetylgalactosaminide beta-1,3-galactosyltransferase n=1 Tax=Elysia crispata TaxID=231223 RepID=A0AAE0Z0I8_9GAST|nr:hypothetical protein RRG08_010661 [Elysia crispata]
MPRLWRKLKYQVLWVALSCIILLVLLSPAGLWEAHKSSTDKVREINLGKSPRIMCWALVRLETYSTKARALQDTWTQRCDKVLFFSSRPTEKNLTVQRTNDSLDITLTGNSTRNNTRGAASDGRNNKPNDSNVGNMNSSKGGGSNVLRVPTIALAVPEGREHLTAKAMLASVYSWRMHGRDFDWFLKSDDDTYIVMENLREMLRFYDPDSPVYFGYRFKPYTPQGYMSGGAGYVLSREALRRLVMDGIFGKFCGPFTGVEDLDIGRCLYTVGVKAGDSVDKLGLERFHPLNFYAYFGDLKLPAWTGDYAFHPFKRGFGCCSNKTISFHYIRTHEMYMLEFLIYHMKL